MKKKMAQSSLKNLKKYSAEDTNGDTVKISITIRGEQLEKIKAIADGSVSFWIRQAIDLYLDDPLPQSHKDTATGINPQTSHVPTHL